MEAMSGFGGAWFEGCWARFSIQGIGFRVWGWGLLTFSFFLFISWGAGGCGAGAQDLAKKDVGQLRS